MTVIANHAHLMPAHVGGSEWPKGNADMLLRHLDFCGIDKAVVFPPFARQMDNSAKKANLWALGEARNHADRFIPAGTMSPLAEDAIELLDLLHGEGIRLVKIHPSIDLHDIADPAAGRFYKKAEKLGMILDYHTGPHKTRLSLAEPRKFDDLAWDYPGLKLVFEHLGGRTYFEEFMAILSNHKTGRIFGGLTSVLTCQKENRLWHLAPEKIAALLECVGADKLIFGLDFPWNAADANKRDIEIIRSLDISAGEKEKILGGNLSGLLGI